MPVLHIDPARVMQSFVHDHTHREWYVAQAGEPDTIITRCDKAGKQVSQAILKGAGHGSSIGISHDQDGDALIWLWWNNFGPVTFHYHAGTHEHTSADVTRLHNLEGAYTLFAVDERNNLLATRVSDAKSSSTFTLRHLDDWLAGIDKPIHRTGTWPLTLAFQGFAIDGPEHFWVALGGSQQSTSVRRYAWDATGWDDGATHSTAHLGPATGYHESEGLAFGSLGGLWVGIVTGTAGHRKATAHQLIAPPAQPQPPPKEPPVSYPIACTASSVLSRFNADLAKYGNQKWCYAYPPLKTMKYQGSTSYYWCAAQVARNLQPGFDFTKHVSLWAYVPALYQFMAAAPASQFRTVAAKDARAGDIVIFQRGGSAAANSYHIGLVRAATSGDNLYTAEGDTSSPQFPGSESTGGVICHKTRSIRAQTTGGYHMRIWRPGYQPEPPKKLAVDGSMGPKTITAMGASDGVISTPVSALVERIQDWLNRLGARDAQGRALAVDGAGLGPNTGHRYPAEGTTHTIEALEGHYGLTVDGFLSPDDSALVRAIQTSINEGTWLK